MEFSNITQIFQTEGIQGLKYPNVKTPKSTVENPSLSRFQVYPIAQTFCGKPERHIMKIQHNMKTSLLHT